MSGVEAEAEAARWLRFAREDLQTAQMLLRDRASLVPRHACWLAQQSAEKAIKALLVRADVDFPRTHDLDRLWQLLSPAERAAIPSHELSSLSEWAVESRYPGDWPDAQAVDAASAAIAALEIFEAVAGRFVT